MNRPLGAGSMTLEEITADLGWGLHDALLQRIEIDWVVGELHLVARVRMDKDQTLDQLARISITGLQYCVVEPPRYEDAAQTTKGEGLWIDDGPGVPDNAGVELPQTPRGCFAHWFFVRQWNSFVYVCGREAKLDWLEPEQRSVETPSLRWPGDEIPDP